MATNQRKLKRNKPPKNNTARVASGKATLVPKWLERVRRMAKTNAKPIQNDFWFCENVGAALPLIALQHSEVEIVVEVIGGLGIAKDLVELAIKNGKKVVTANKAFLAECGDEIVELLKNNKGYIAFEASTAGANPVIKTFKESFTSSEITEFYAIS